MKLGLQMYVTSGPSIVNQFCGIDFAKPQITKVESTACKLPPAWCNKARGL